MKLNKRVVAGIACGVLILIFAAVFLIFNAGKQLEAKEEMDKKIAVQNAPRPVQMERVRAISAETKRSYPGIVKASNESDLSFRVGGPLVEVNVKLGKPVAKGDLLMQIDPRDFEDRIQSLEAQLAGALALRQNATQNYKRISELFEQKVVSQSDFDAVTSARDSADASVKNVEAELQIARHALEDTSLIAPYDGTVTARLVENKEMVEAGQMVLHFHNIQILEVTVSVPENEIAIRTIDEDTPVWVSFPSVPNHPYDARLKEWSSAADPLTRTYAVTFVFEAPEAFRILPGMSASISLALGSGQKNVLSVPVSALVSGSDGNTFVWVPDEAGGTAEQRQVVVGGLKGTDRMIVLSGISAGEQVVVSGSRLINDHTVLKAATIR